MMVRVEAIASGLLSRRVDLDSTTQSYVLLSEFFNNLFVEQDKTLPTDLDDFMPMKHSCALALNSL